MERLPAWKARACWSARRATFQSLLYLQQMERRSIHMTHVGSARSSARRHSTIDAVIRAGYELPAIRCEERDDLRDFLSFAVS